MEQIHWFPGHMSKAIKLIDQQIKLIDLVIEVLDSRIPISSSNNLLDKLRGNKPKIIILNKSDLADYQITQQWQKEFLNNAIILDSKHQNISNIIIKKINDILQPQIIKQQQRGIINPKMKVLVVGIPNVGKSTFINKIANKQVTKIGNKPGVTTGQQWIKINKIIDLIDSPGILPPKIQNEITAIKLALARTIKEEILPLEKIAFYGLKWLYSNYQTNLFNIYPKWNLSAKILENDYECYQAFLSLQKIRWSKINENQTEKNYYDFLLKIWNHEFGPVSFERPV